MNPQIRLKPRPVITMFLKPSFSVTAQSSGLKVAVTLQLPVARPDTRN